MIGTGHCTGVTHYCILMANYLAGVLRKRVAVLEWNNHDDFERMEQFCMKKTDNQKPFELLEVHYYKSAGEEELVRCMELNYDKIIIDFGTSVGIGRMEYLRCDKKAVLMALSEWQIDACLEFALWVDDKQRKNWGYFTVFGSEESRREIVKKLKIPLKRIPYSEDAFAVTGELMAYFKKI